MALPVPVIDHVVINVRDRLDEAAALYGRLGFQLTPRGYHTLGSSNNLAILGPDYIELLGVLPGGAGRSDVLDWPAGLNGLVFRTLSAEGTYAALHGAGVPVLPPQAFSRPVDLGGASADAAFRTVRVEREAAPAGRVFFCHHLTPHLVWREEWQRHPNGALGILGAVVAAADPAGLGALFTRMFGSGAVQQTPDGCRLLAGLAAIEVVTPGALAARFGAAAPRAEGRAEFMAALVLRTASLHQAGAALRAGRIGAAQQGGQLVVPAGETGGTTLVFRAE